jgi:TPP-dependent pyruvate/acetoin dehydrogenase alpha subunit
MNVTSIMGGDLRRLPREKFGPAGRMIQLRLWQHLVNELLKQKAFSIPIHLGFGTEAMVTAVDEMLHSSDELVLTHRNAVFNMARAASLQPILDEYLLLPSGYGEGKLGSMNLSNASGGISYSSSILGNNLSVACGLAFARTLQAKSGVVCVVTGDGAMEEGGFYESLVFAKSHGLRILFVVDNNDYSMASRIEERRCPIRIDLLCQAIGIPCHLLQGNNLADYVKTTQSVRQSIEDNGTPACIEFRTVLLNQHAGPTPGWPTDPLRIDINDGLLIGNTFEDPLIALRDTLGTLEFESIARHLGAITQH